MGKFTEGHAAIAGLLRRKGSVELSAGAPWSESMLRFLGRGERDPSSELRAALRERLGIPLGAWKKAAPKPFGRGRPLGSKGKPKASAKAASPATSAASAPAAVVDEAPIPPDAPPAERARAQVERIEARIAAAYANDETSAREIAALEASLTSALRLQSRLAGAHEITAQMILTSPYVVRVTSIIENALKPFPVERAAYDAAVEAFAARHPELSDVASPRARSAAQVERLTRYIGDASKSGASEKSLSALENTLTSASRLRARLVGALEISEAQICKSTLYLEFQHCALGAVAIGEKNLPAIDACREALRRAEEGAA